MEGPPDDDEEEEGAGAGAVMTGVAGGGARRERERKKRDFGFGRGLGVSTEACAASGSVRASGGSSVREAESDLSVRFGAKTAAMRRIADGRRGGMRVRFRRLRPFETGKAGKTSGSA